MVQVFLRLREGRFLQGSGIILCLMTMIGVGGCRATEPAPVLAVPGLLWSVADDRGIKPDELVHRLSRHDVVMLGEMHDNPRHHAIEAELIRALATTRQLQVVALEMLDREQQATLERVWAEGDVDAVLAATDFDARGWGADRYRPVVEAMLEAEVDPLAANLSRADAGQVVKDGWTVHFDARQQDELALDDVWNEALASRLTGALRDSHCGMLPEAMIPGMLAAQRARDAVIADRVLTRHADGVILVAGGQHVRGDYGVPAYLRARVPDLNIATVLLLEVDGQRPVSEYLAAWPELGAAPLYDFVWFTTRAEREDPCALFEAQQSRKAEDGR
jgi:uncharacterized iron-regulated protein